jgi:hypothetical protein
MSDNQWDAAGYLDDKIAKLRAENADLTAKVEALRKSVSALTEAGDELWFSIRHYSRQDKSERLDAIEDWQYAKEKADRNR